MSSMSCQLITLLVILISVAEAGVPRSAVAMAALPLGQPGVRLSWVRGPSAAGCPDATTIEADTVRRLGHNPFAQRPAHFIEAVVTREVESYRVTILMRDGEGKLLGSRVLNSGASDCRPLATAAALTIAILIDPDALSRTSADAPAQPVVMPPPPAPGAREAAPKAVTARRAGRVMATGLVGWGLLPDAAFGASLATTVDVGRYGAVGMVLGVLPEQRSPISGGDFAFGLSFAQLVGCFARPGTLVRLELCGGGMVSALHVVVYAPEPDNPGQKWMVGATEMARSVVKLVGSAVLEVGLSASEGWPRRSFFIAGRPTAGNTVFAQPAVALAAWIGVGVGWQ
ncbi:MAG: hypothetical protein ABIS92_02550 [Polyangia bacterium]